MSEPEPVDFPQIELPPHEPDEAVVRGRRFHLDRAAARAFARKRLEDWKAAHPK